MGLKTIRIDGDGQPEHTRVFLDDQDISRFVRNLKVEIGVDKAWPTVTVELTGNVVFSREMKVVVVPAQKRGRKKSDEQKAAME